MLRKSSRLIQIGSFPSIAVVGTSSPMGLSANRMEIYSGLACAEGHPAGIPANPNLPPISESFTFGEPVLDFVDDRLVLKDLLPLTYAGQGF